MLNNESQINDISYHKKHFLHYLGAKNNQDLYENILASSISGDSFESNCKAIFENYYLEDGKSSENFYRSFLDWGEKKLNKSFKLRWKIAGINSVGLLGAFGLNFINPIAGIATGVAVSGIAGIAEGVAKRNIVNFGHLQQHFSHKIHGCTTNLIEKALKIDNITDEAKELLKKLEHPEKRDKKSALARMASYFSGPVVSGVNNLTSRFTSISTVASGVIGAFIPFLPLVTVGFSSISSNIRHKSALVEADFIDKVVDIIFDKKSWKDESRALPEIQRLTNEYACDLAKSDCHGRIPENKKYHKAESGSKDKVTNIKKAITLPVWITSKINKTIKSYFKKESHDISEKPKEKINFDSDFFDNKLNDSEAKSSYCIAETGFFDQLNTVSDEARKDQEVLICKTGAWQSRIEQLIIDFQEKLNAEILTDEDMRDSKNERQNKIINNILKECREFILDSEIKDDKKNQTNFVYIDPDFQNSDYFECESRKISCVRNDVTKKINVIYGKKADAILIKRPNQDKEGFIVKIINGKIEYFGKDIDDIFSFATQKDLPSSTPIEFSVSPFEGRSLANMQGIV